MPRWPAQQVENTDPPPRIKWPAPPPPEAPAPPKPVYDYSKMNPEDAETGTYPYTGETVLVSDTLNYPGFAAKWRVTRQLKGWKWVKTGMWVTPMMNNGLPFEPIYWRKFSNLEES